MRKARLVCTASACALTLVANTGRGDVIVSLALTARASAAATPHQGGLASVLPAVADAWAIAAIPHSISRQSVDGPAGDAVWAWYSHCTQSSQVVRLPSAREQGIAPEKTEPAGHQACGEAPAGVVQELPPPPSSSSLAFTGLVGVASLRGLRAARGLHLGLFPAWSQGFLPSVTEVGVISDCSLPAAAAFVSDAVAASQRHSGLKPPIPWVLPTRLESQHLPPASIPRGPPLDR